MDRAGLDSLRARVRAIEGGGVDFGRAVARLGPPLDAALPWGGLPYRALHEIGGLAATSAVAGFARRFLARGGGAGLVPQRQGRGRAGRALWPGPRPVRPRARAADPGALRRRGRGAVVVRGGAALPRRRLRRGRDRPARPAGQPPAAARGRGRRRRRAGAAARARPLPNAALTRWRAEPLADRRRFLAADPVAGQGWCPGVWTVRWDERALAFAPTTGEGRNDTGATGAVAGDASQQSRTRVAGAG